MNRRGLLPAPPTCALALGIGGGLAFFGHSSPWDSGAGDHPGAPTPQAGADIVETAAASSLRKPATITATNRLGHLLAGDIEISGDGADRDDGITPCGLNQAERSRGSLNDTPADTRANRIRVGRPSLRFIRCPVQRFDDTSQEEAGNGP